MATNRYRAEDKAGNRWSPIAHYQQHLDDRKFQVSCKADPKGILAAAAKTVVLTVGQRVRREHQEEMWDSVSVSAEEHPNGDLTLKVLVFNPDWDDPLQITCVRSRPHDPSCMAPVSFYLDHVTS